MKTVNPSTIPKRLSTTLEAIRDGANTAKRLAAHLFIVEAQASKYLAEVFRLGLADRVRESNGQSQTYVYSVKS